jgi:exopolyphosphatase/pppGpp-phosphohydrolase
MYDEKMATAVNTAQKRLMDMAGGSSVLMSVTNDLAELSVLIEKLDPSKIDFDKGGLEKLKINNYWNRFDEAYPAFQAVIERLARDRKILHNSSVTVNRFYSEFCEAYDSFHEVPEEERDEEYIRQAAVTENMAMLIKSTIDEHKAVCERVDTVLMVTEISLNIAVYLAKQKFGRSIGAAGNVPATGEISSGNFKKQFAMLKNILSDNK